jgi:NAD(P)-dependent dehydrogenase (short-subunit alcohol dehydrogenase family)
MSNLTRQHPSVAIVTGASRGIGRATAIALSEKGWGVALVSRSEQHLRETASHLKQSLIVPLDVADPANAAQIVLRTMDQFGRLEAVVNNAGVAPMLSVEQTTDDIWRQAIDTNLSAAFYLSRAAWPIFKKQGGGVIVNVSSAASRDPFSGFAAYGAAKAGLNVLGLSLAREGAEHNIRVHTVAPGATETEMFRSLPGMSAYPRDKTLSPDDVARVIVQCIAGDLSHTSGEVIHVHKGA